MPKLYFMIIITSNSIGESSQKKRMQSKAYKSIFIKKTTHKQSIIYQETYHKCNVMFSCVSTSDRRILQSAAALRCLEKLC